MTNCPICNGKIEHTSKIITYEYKNHSVQINQLGEYCSECGESFLSPKDLKSSKKEIADFKREVDHLLKSDDLKRIRKKTNLTQEEAAVLFGGGIRAFHKYETGENIQSKPLDILLKLID
ncbi:MAG: HTH-type transcriptional regulator / antitoxin MqsA, partial [Campylobacterota bacterium]|nr:HTH-type transcriptional regulator / antitoxin MqsA [Campylobacterota bacterium]